MTPRISLRRPQLLPVHLEPTPQPAFHARLEHLQQALGDLADFLPPAPLAAGVPPGVDAVVTPDLSGVAYSMLDAFRAVTCPILVITSPYATVSMWDWEIRDHLRRRGVATVAPLTLQESRDACRALAMRRTLAGARMLAYQDEIGAGKQPDIFKRFYWWEDACVADIERQFGVVVEHRSWRALAARAAQVSDARADEILASWDATMPMPGLGQPARRGAVKLYAALADELDEAGDVVAAGINCLNESDTCSSTPCLAWSRLFDERGLMWGCEADLSSMLTEFIVHMSLDVPVVMSNLYPFVIGQAALAHERIPHFPAVEGRPEDHVLVAHCGYFALTPQSFATSWAARPPVLAIVDEQAHALDARIPTGPTMLVKLADTMDRLVCSQGELVDFVQYPGSDCLNGAVVKVRDGYHFVEHLPSHHTILAVGDLERRLAVVAQVAGLGVESI